MQKKFQIIESKKITDVLDLADEKTLVAFDIDNTLIDTVQDFGGYAWAVHVTKRYMEKGYSKIEALYKSYNAFHATLPFLSFKIIEPETPSVVKQLQEKGIVTMGMTARSFPLAQQTLKNLLSVDISFAKNSVHEKEVVYDKMSGFLKGILFAGPEMQKGSCFLSFLEEIGCKPEHILFVDDARHNVEDVYQAMNAKNIPVTCLRYGATDEREAKFDPARADKMVREMMGTERFKEVFGEVL